MLFCAYRRLSTGKKQTTEKELHILSTTTCIIIMAVCLLLSAYFSATETAFSAANTTRLRTLAEKGNLPTEEA